MYSHNYQCHIPRVFVIQEISYRMSVCRILVSLWKTTHIPDCGMEYRNMTVWEYELYYARECANEEWSATLQIILHLQEAAS